MPVWVEVIVAVGAVLGVVTLVWAKVIKPLNSVAVSLNKILPTVKRMSEQWFDDPKVFEILDEIVRQVRTDSGSSLLDKINTITDKVHEAVELLTAQTREARTAAEILAAQVEAVKQLAAIERKQSVRDRAQVDEMDAGLARMALALVRLEASINIIEAEGTRVSSELTKSQRRADIVAALPESETGAAADAASGSSQDEE